MNIQRIAFPEVQIWNTSKLRLHVVNEEDMHIEETLRALGLEDSRSLLLPVSDKEEIERRQALLSFFMRQSLFANSFKTHAKALAGSGTISERGETWLSFSDPHKEHSQYWECLANFDDCLNTWSETDFPEAIKQIRNLLPTIFASEEQERQMAAEIRETLLGMVKLRGLVRYRLRTHKAGLAKLETLGHCCIGHNAYMPMPARMPKKCEQWPLLGRAVKRWNTAVYDRTVRRHLISRLPKELLADINAGVGLRFEQENWRESEWEGLEGAMLTVHYTYGTDGLRLSIAGLELADEEPEQEMSMPCDGYTKAERRIKAKIEQQLKNFLRLQVEAIKRDQYRTKFANWQSPQQAPSPQADAIYHNGDISVLIRRDERSELNEIYKIARQHRAWLNGKLAEICRVIEVSEALSWIQSDTGLPTCFPLIHEQRGVSFRALWPVQLLARHRAKELSPIKDMPKLDGSVVALTGGNATGKSVTLQTISTDVWMAHVGLPVFGQGFETGVLKSLGVLTLERGEGSTVELMLGKLTEIFNWLQRSPGKALLVLDELGSATQEELGFELGRDVLSALKKREEHSVLFCTQILELAGWARDNVSASCVQMDADHRISSGVAKGDIETLRQRTGIDKFLRKGGE